MKTSTFLTKTLNSFRNGKGYWNPANANYSSKGRNIVEALHYIEDKTGEKKANRSLASLSVSLGHTNIWGFGRSSTNSFSKVKAIFKAAIKRERANGN